MTPNEKVKKMMKSKVKAKDLWSKREPNLHEKITLQLASEIHYSESECYSISWSAQERAMEYFNKNGFEKSLEYMLELQTKRLEKEQCS